MPRLHGTSQDGSLSSHVRGQRSDIRGGPKRLTSPGASLLSINQTMLTAIDAPGLAEMRIRGSRCGYVRAPCRDDSSGKVNTAYSSWLRIFVSGDRPAHECPNTDDRTPTTEGPKRAPTIERRSPRLGHHAPNTNTEGLRPPTSQIEVTERRGNARIHSGPQVHSAHKSRRIALTAPAEAEKHH